MSYTRFKKPIRKIMKLYKECQDLGLKEQAKGLIEEVLLVSKNKKYHSVYLNLNYPELDFYDYKFKLETATIYISIPFKLWDLVDGTRMDQSFNESTIEVLEQDINQLIGPGSHSYLGYPRWNSYEISFDISDVKKIENIEEYAIILGKVIDEFVGKIRKRIDQMERVYEV